MNIGKIFTSIIVLSICVNLGSSPGYGWSLFPKAKKTAETVSSQQELKQGVTRVKKYIAAGNLSKAEEELSAIEEKFPDEPNLETLSKEIELRKYISLRRIKAGLDTVTKLIDEDKEEEARRKTEEIKAHSSYIPDFYQQEIDALLGSIEEQKSKEKPKQILRKTAQEKKTKARAATVDKKMAAEAKRHEQSLKAASRRETERLRVQSFKKRTEETKKAEKLIAQRRFSEAEILVDALILRYPKDKKISGLKRKLDKESATVRQRQAALNQALSESQAEHKIKSALQDVQELSRQGKLKEAERTIASLSALYPRHKEIKLVKQQIAREKKAQLRIRKKEARQLFKQKKKVPVPVSNLSASERKEKQKYIKKVYQEAARSYRRKAFADSIKLFETVIKLEKNSLQHYTPSAKKLMEKARKRQ